MKCNPQRWLWGLIPIALLSGLAAFSIRSSVEEDLWRRVNSAMGQAELAWPKLTFEGRDLLIAGKADGDDEPGQAVRIANAIYGVRVVEVKADLLPKVEPYTWSAVLKDDAVTLAGHVPSEKARKAIVSAARSAFPRGKVEDRMELARGNPALSDWQPAYQFAFKQLALLKGGKAALSDLTLSLDGEARNSAAYRDVKTALTTGLKGVTLGTDGVIPPVIEPYSWKAKLSGNEAILSGYVPNDKLRAELLASAQRAFGKTPVVDRMEPGSGAPKEWLKAVSLAIDQLATLQEGSSELKATEISLSGTASDDDIAAATRKAFIGKMPKGYVTTEAIKGLRPAMPLINPYTTRIEATTAGIEVAGYVPSEGARDAVLKAVQSRFPGRKVSDKLQLGTGEPSGFDTCLLAAVGGLNKVGNGSVQLTGKTVELSGVTEDETLAMTLPGEVRNAARGVCDTKVLVRYDDSNKRKAAEDAAARAKSEIEAAERARRDADAAARSAAEAEARRLASEADAKRQAADAEAQRISLAEQAKRNEAASACERAMRSTASPGVIQFERASDVLLRDSRPVLRKLVEVAKTCENSIIEVQGHTDAEGVPDRNQPLSERRAKAVLDFLVDAGVPADRITAVGYGDTQPVADNTTAEGRAKNRRIEFTVKAK